MRSLIAILAGYFSMAILVMAMLFAAKAVAPDFVPDTPEQITRGYLAFNLVVSALAAIFGGIMAAKVAGRAPFSHSLMLALAALVLGIWYTRTMWSQSPHGYLLGLMAITAPSIALGGWLQARKQARSGMIMTMTLTGPPSPPPQSPPG